MRYKAMEDKSANEFYETPVEAVKLARPLMNPDLDWWEPCAGRKAISNQFSNIVLSTDLNVMVDGVTQMDVMECDKPEGIQGLITNPPFTIGAEIVERALFEWKIPALMLMRVEYMAGNGNSAKMKPRMRIRQHMTKMHVITNLVKFPTESGRVMNGNGTGRVAWMLFEPDKTPETLEMKWAEYATDGLGK